jgi:hypothetical protein
MVDIIFPVWLSPRCQASWQSTMERNRHMKQNSHHLQKMLGMVFVLGLCSGCCSTQVETSSLKDTLLAVRNQAEAAGASKVTYEASVVTTAQGNLSLVVPVVTSPTIGFTGKREIGSKVTIEMDLKQQKQALEQPSGKRYLLDLKSLKAKELK